MEQGENDVEAALSKEDTNCSSWSCCGNEGQPPF